MERRYVEPRRFMWATAEVSWSDAGGVKTAAATIEDMSVSGACLRLRAPIGVGSQLKVKWHREEFCAVARNRRSDGIDFLLGVRREARQQPTLPHQSISRASGGSDNRPAAKAVRPSPRVPAETSAVPSTSVIEPKAVPALALSAETPFLLERKVMQSKRLFPNLWRR